MDSSFFEQNHRGFLVLYRYFQIHYRNSEFMTDKTISLNDRIELHKSVSNYAKLVKEKGQEEADKSAYLGALMVFLFAFYGPGQAERAWKAFVKILTPQGKVGAE